MNALVFAGVSLRRLLRDRTALFFVVALPVAIIVILGVTITGFDEFRVGVVMHDSGPLGQRLAAALDASPSLATRAFTDEEAGRVALRRAEVDAVVVVPASYDGDLRAGKHVDVTVMSGRASTNGPAVSSAVDSVIAAQGSIVQAARFATREVGGSIDANLARAERAAHAVPAVAVRDITVDRVSSTLPQGFSYSTPTMLVLFVFINSLASGAAVIQTRKLGIYGRALAAPVRTRSMVFGEALAYFSLALMQSLLIVAIGAVAFGVSWGNPVAATLLIVVWALVGTGAGMLSGTLFATPEQASAMGPSVGIALGMLGGCMWPLSIVGTVVREVGHLAPQAWAVDAWTVLLSQGGNAVTIARPLLILIGYAVALLALASVRLRRRVIS